MTATTTAPSATPQPEPPGKWTARYTWRVPEGSKHPTTTEATHPSETAAFDAAVAVLDKQPADAALKVVRAEVRGPSGGWRPVE